MIATRLSVALAAMNDTCRGAVIYPATTEDWRKAANNAIRETCLIMAAFLIRWAEAVGVWEAVDQCRYLVLSTTGVALFFVLSLPCCLCTCVVWRKRF